jgi:hypothetical protein
MIVRRLRRAARNLAKHLLRLRRSHAEVLVLGDSHAAVFLDKAIRRRFPGYFFDVVSIDGATASGLNNPNSKTQALPIFTRSLARTRADTIVVLLGEVDAGFVIWHRAEKHGTDAGAMLEAAQANYQAFLRPIAGRFRLICVSAPLPTIPDGQAWGKVANARRSIRATQRERTALTLRFNERTRAFCAANGIDFLDLDAQSLGADGLVDARLLGSNPADHHYDQAAYAAMLMPKLATRLEVGGATPPTPRGS